MTLFGFKAEGVFETRWSVKYTVMRSVFYGFGQGRRGMLQQRRLHDDSPSTTPATAAAAAARQYSSKRQLARAPNIFIDYSESSSGSCSGLRCEIIWTKTPGMSNNNA